MSAHLQGPEPHVHVISGYQRAVLVCVGDVYILQCSVQLEKQSPGGKKPA